MGWVAAARIADALDPEGGSTEGGGVVGCAFFINPNEDSSMENEDSSLEH